MFKKSILECVPQKYNPRKAQSEALSLIEASWSSHDVFVVNLPVATGKSLIAQTISRWASQSPLTTLDGDLVTESSGEAAPPAKVPGKGKKSKGHKVLTLASNNLLLEQYAKDYPKLATLHGMRHYMCGVNRMNLAEKKKRNIAYCSPAIKECTGCQKYLQDLKKIMVVPYGLVNYHTYLARKLHKVYDVLVVDEAHNLIPVLQDLGSATLWWHLIPKPFRYDLNMKGIQELRAWIQGVPEDVFLDDDGGVKKKAFAKFKWAAFSDKYIFKITEEEYRGEDKPCIKLIPIDISEEPKLFFPPNIKKIVLLTATISQKDVEQLGLYTKRIKYIQARSPIPANRRPVVVAENGFSLSYQNQTDTMPDLAAMIERLVDERPGDKGLIHIPYSMARKLAIFLGDHPRLLFHTKENKAAQYKKFREANQDLVLVASGMYEGIDLPYDAGQFQLIAKIPFSSLAEPAIKMKAERDAEWYAWETTKVVQQACGRICRAPNDYGETIILDKAFNRLYRNNTHFYPDWFVEALHWNEV